MLAGADCIDDLDVLRAGAGPQLWDDLRAPSTIGTWLRAFKWSNVRELDAVTRETMRRAWAAGLGPVDLAGPLTIDIDSSICQTYGVAKQGGTFGYTKVRGCHPLLATIAATGEVAHSRLGAATQALPEAPRPSPPRPSPGSVTPERTPSPSAAEADELSRLIAQSDV